MPDLAGLLLRRSVGALRSEGSDCGRCRRTPLPGERLHEMESGKMLCELCLLSMPEDDRTAVRVEKIHVSDSHIAVARRAA